jgi:hypothetical protein
VVVKNFLEAITHFLDDHAKAIVSGLVMAIAMYFTLAHDGDGMTSADWQTLTASFVAATGLVYYIPNAMRNLLPRAVQAELEVGTADLPPNYTSVTTTHTGATVTVTPSQATVTQDGSTVDPPETSSTPPTMGFAPGTTVRPPTYSDPALPEGLVTSVTVQPWSDLISYDPVADIQRAKQILMGQDELWRLEDELARRRRLRQPRELELGDDEVHI